MEQLFQSLVGVGVVWAREAIVGCFFSVESFSDTSEHHQSGWLRYPTTVKGEIRIALQDSDESVSALLQRPENAFALIVLAHGAGAGMTHPFMEDVSERLVKKGLGVLRFQFPYMEKGRRRPDHKTKLVKACADALEVGLREGLPVFVGGKSMGGRMMSHLLVDESVETIESVRGVVYWGFPLHPAGKPGTTRAEHLDGVGCPMLFLQGTRDRLADLKLITEVTNPLAGSTLKIIDGADHGFAVLKRSGRTSIEVMEELTEEVVRFCRSLA